MSDANRHNGPGADAPPRYSLLSGYSAFVGFMKLALPAIGVGLILLIFIWPQLRDEGRVAIESLEVTEQDLSARKMRNPRYESYDSDDRPFIITADEASQERANKNLIDLAAPKAKVQMEGGQWVDVEAPKGVYNEKAEIVRLEGGVQLHHEDGITLETDSVRILVKKGRAVSETPVVGSAPEGELQGEGFRLVDEGRIIFLDGQSRVVLYERPTSGDSVPPNGGTETNEKEADSQ